jgi:hypothetical protein
MSLLGKLAKLGFRSAQDIAERVMPMVLQTGDKVLVENTTNALRKMGASVPSQPGPGLLGTLEVKTSRQLGQAPKPAFGPGANNPAAPAGARPTNTLVTQPFQGPRTRGGELVRTQAPAAAPTTRTQFTEDLITQPTMQGAQRAPVQGPSMTGTPVQGQLDLRFPSGARSTAEFTTAKGALRPEGTPIGGQPYRGGPVASQANLEVFNPPALQGPGRAPMQGPSEAAGVQGSFFLDNVPDIWSGGFRMRPELIRQLPKEVQERIGTSMVREAADLGPVAPRPAFGPDAGPAPVDSAAAMAFARNAASGAELVDLGALLNNPAFRAATGAAGLGLFGAGIAGMSMGGNRTGETTAGAPPELPLPPSVNAPLFAESDGSPLGDGAPGVTAPNPPAPGNIDPTAPAPVVTSGGIERESAMRAALAQNAPAAAAVQRATEPMSPERYKSIEDYYAARQAYAGSADKRRELMRYMGGQSPAVGSQLASWAQSNPALAYEYQRRQLVNPAANQQSSESITTTVVTTPMGSETAANAVGNAESTADAALKGTQEAQALKYATTPNVQPNLQRVQDFIRTQAPRAAMYAGY